MSTAFKGFPKEMFDFLRKLKKNNNREWFQKNKNRYQEFVVTPMCAFITAIAPKLQQTSACFVADARPHGGSMFRIYRDTRFSNDKRPYKDNVGCQFRHTAGKDAHAPGYYVHLEPGKVFFGGGIWQPPNPVLEKIRFAIIDNPVSWSRIIQDKAFKKFFGGVQGDGLKKPPRGYSADHKFIEDLKRKSFFAMREGDEALAKSPKFLKEIEKSLRLSAPLMQFITDALELPFSQEG